MFRKEKGKVSSSCEGMISRGLILRVLLPKVGDRLFVSVTLSKDDSLAVYVVLRYLGFPQYSSPNLDHDINRHIYCVQSQGFQLLAGIPC